MNITAQIQQRINRFPTSQPFGYAQLNIEQDVFLSAAKALERLRKKGIIKRLSKGIFYKPETSVFGELPPNYTKLLDNYLFENGKRVGYVTGIALYNRLHLTTQMAFVWKIATNKNLKKIEQGWLKTYAVRAYAKVTDKNYRLLEILDALKDINKIPDTSSTQALRVIMNNYIKAFSQEEITGLMRYALQYPPRVRAVLGAVLDYLFEEDYDTRKLKKSLNPATTFKLSIKPTDLPTAPNWNIKY